MHGATCGALAKERAAGMTLDSSIVELGLDSLERMEIVAALEEQFGGRFPEEVLHADRNCREVAAAVERYLGKAAPVAKPAEVERRNPAGLLPLRPVPRISEAEAACATRCRPSGLQDPYFKVHEGVINDTTTIDGRELVNFASYNYLGMSGDPKVVRGHEAGHRPLRHQRLGQPAGFRRKGAPRRAGTGASPNSWGPKPRIVFVGGHATNETTLGHLFGPGDLILHDALAHNSIVQGASCRALAAGPSRTTTGKRSINC